jgi:phosphoesterase RecJ-like protein
MEKTYKAIADLIGRSDSFLITMHIDPDGDAVGCALSIYSVLERLGKTVKVIAEDPVPANFDFLEGSDEVITAPTDAAEVAIVVDSGSLSRIGWPRDVVLKCPVIVNIDHHGSNDNFGHHNLVVRTAGACGELVYKLLRVLDVDLTAGEAEALYVAILSDTGCFRFPTTTAETMRIAAHLLDRGVKPYHAASEIFWKRSPAALMLLSSALSSIEVTNGGAIASMDVTRKMFTETGAGPRDTEGFANYPRSIRDVRVGILFREIGDKRYRVSLRAREGHAIDAIAKHFGGGGHPTAAGFRIEGDLETIKTDLRNQIHTKVLSPDDTSGA